MLDLWPYQERVVLTAKEAVKTHRSICIVMPTGSGKTAVAAHITHQIMRQLGTRTAGVALFLVHRKELINQTMRTMDTIGLKGEYGVIAAGRAGTPWAPIQIASIPTLTRRLEKHPLLKPQVIFIDEAHHAAAATWEKIIRRWPRAFRIGLTATPARHDEKGLAHLFDHLVMGPTINELAPEYLAPVETHTVKREFRQQAKTLKAQFAEATEGPVIADVVTSWKRLAIDRKTLFFAVNVEHSKMIVERLKAAGVAAAHVDWSTPKAERERILALAEDGKYQCISNSKLFTEGTDWPGCQCVVLARSTGSIVDFKQMVGRAMRKKPNGGNAMLIDLAGNVWEHGLPNEEVEWSLEHGVAIKEKKKVAAKVRRCEECGYAYHIKESECPLCGAEPTRKQVLEVEAELAKLDAPPPKPKGPTKRRLSARIIATKGDLHELEKIRREYNYARGWVYAVQRAYRGYWR